MERTDMSKSCPRGPEHEREQPGDLDVRPSWIRRRLSLRIFGWSQALFSLARGAGSKAELDALLAALPLYEWMHTSITPLLEHPNGSAGNRAIA